MLISIYDQHIVHREIFNNGMTAIIIFMLTSRRSTVSRQASSDIKELNAFWNPWLVSLSLDCKIIEGFWGAKMTWMYCSVALSSHKVPFRILWQFAVNTTSSSGGKISRAKQLMGVRSWWIFAIPMLQLSSSHDRCFVWEPGIHSISTKSEWLVYHFQI